MPASFFKGPVSNGFKTIPEIPSITCRDESFAPHTLPADAIKFQPPSEAVVTMFKNGDQERKIHCNTKLSQSETERLAMLRAEAKAQGVDLYPSVTCMATRFLSRARMDHKKALRLMKDTQAWRTEYFKDGPISDESVIEDLAHGIVYFTGRDMCLRPAIVIRAARIPQQWYKEKRIDKFIRILIFSMEYFLRYMVVPGRVENLSVIVDLATLGLSQVPLGALGEVYKVLGHHYIGRVFKFYVVNVSSALSAIAGMAKSFLTDRQKQKLNILDDVAELQKEFALTQLEQDLGGNRPAVSKFFPFPLQPGPFTPGYAGEPDHSAVQNVHELLTLGGALGRLWDPKLTPEENTRLEYTHKAAAIFEKCGLPVPPEAWLDRAGSKDAVGSSSSAELAKGATVDVLTPSTDAGEEGSPDNGEFETTPFGDLELRTDDVLSNVIGGNNPHHEIQSTSVCGSKGLFCCSI